MTIPEGKGKGLGGESPRQASGRSTEYRGDAQLEGRGGKGSGRALARRGREPCEQHFSPPPPHPGRSRPDRFRSSHFEGRSWVISVGKPDPSRGLF